VLRTTGGLGGRRAGPGCEREEVEEVLCKETSRLGDDYPRATSRKTAAWMQAGTSVVVRCFLLLLIPGLAVQVVRRL
jgi:hypothetical protein